jgi:hypothetical protein
MSNLPSFLTGDGVFSVLVATGLFFEVFGVSTTTAFICVSVCIFCSGCFFLDTMMVLFVVAVAAIEVDMGSLVI